MSPQETTANTTFVDGDDFVDALRSQAARDFAARGLDLVRELQASGRDHTVASRVLAGF
jgi:hypothetical protein